MVSPLEFQDLGIWDAFHIRTYVCCSAAMVFLSKENISVHNKNIMIVDCLMIFLQNDSNISSNLRIITKTGILDPIEFWWVT